MNRNLINSNVRNRSTDRESDLFPPNNNYIEPTDSSVINGNRVFPVMRWQLEEIFDLFNEVVFRVKNIDYPESIDISLIPLSDSLKVQLFNHQNDPSEYFFVLSKSDYDSYLIMYPQNLFFIKILKTGSIYSLFIERITWTPTGGGAEDPQTNGVRIPNPPPSPAS